MVLESIKQKDTTSLYILKYHLSSYVLDKLNNLKMIRLFDFVYQNV